MNKDTIRTILNKVLDEKKLFFPFIDDLNGRESLVLKLRKDGKTLEQIADSIYITRERVRQIEAKANDKYRLRNNAIEILVEALSESLFSESEIEKAFASYTPSNVSVAELNLEWNKFAKKLWDLKRKNL